MCLANPPHLSNPGACFGVIHHEGDNHPKKLLRVSSEPHLVFFFTALSVTNIEQPGSHLVPTLLCLHLSGIISIYFGSPGLLFNVGSCHLAVKKKKKKVIKILFSPVWSLAKHFLLPQKNTEAAFLTEDEDKRQWNSWSPSGSLWKSLKKLNCSCTGLRGFCTFPLFFFPYCTLVRIFTWRQESLFKYSSLFFCLLRTWNPNPLLVTSQQDCCGNYYTAKAQRTVTPGRE